MSEWKYSGELCGTIYYDKGDETRRLSVAFNTEAKNIDIYETYWKSNGTPVLVPQDHVTRWSAAYGHFQRDCPTLEVEDVEWIAKKARELFG